MTEAAVDASGRGTAKLKVPTEVSGMLDLGGSLEAQGKLLQVFPGAKLTARLGGHADVAAKGEAVLDVAVSQRPDGELAFDTQGVMGGELVGGLDLGAGLGVEALGKTLWSADWTLASQRWQSGAKVEGTWSAQVGADGVKAEMAVDESALDASGLVDAAFAQANVSQQDGEDNPWKCRRDGNDIVGDFKDFPWGGANGAPAYPSAPVQDHPANDWSKMVIGNSVPRPAGPYRIVPGQGTKGGEGFTKSRRDKLNADREKHKTELAANDPMLEDDEREKAAKRLVEQENGGMGWTDLYLLEWECHHIQEVNWNGAHAASNLKFIRAASHKPYTSWASSHREAMRWAVGIKK